MNKKLLIIYNCFGKNMFMKKQINSYIKNINSILKLIDKYNLKNDVRFVISGCCLPKYVINALKREFGNEIKLFHYEDRYVCTVTFNKTALHAEEYFNEKYHAYHYTSSGVEYPIEGDYYIRALDKMLSDQYGMIMFQTDNDQGYQYLGYLKEHAGKIDYSQDYQIPIGCFTAGHTFMIHNSVKEFFGKPLSDVHGNGGLETSFSYICASLRKQYILLGNSEVHESPTLDAQNTCDKPNFAPHFWYLGLLYGRTYEDTFLADKEGIEAGLGYHNEINRILNAEHGVLPDKYIIAPNLDKYDENYFSTDERLKYSVKRNYFTNDNDINYKNIEVTVY